MRNEVLAKRILRRIISEQIDEPLDALETPSDSSSPYDEQDDWSSPTGRKSNAYKVAEETARQNPQALLDRLGSTKMDTPSTGTSKDVENYLRQVIMRHPDLSLVYKTVTSSKGYIYIERRKSVDTSGFSAEKSFMTGNAAAARYISLLLVAAGRLGWIKFKPGSDTVMFGGEEKSVIRVSLPSYGSLPSGGTKQTSTKDANAPENKK
jgi:hypothetical protein